MKKFGKKIIILLVSAFLLIVSSLAFALGFFQEGTWIISSQSQESFVQELRIQAIQQLIEQKFDRFVTMPFGPGNDFMHLSGSQVYPDYPGYLVTTGIDVQDDLDILLENKIQEFDTVHPFYFSLVNFSASTLVLTEDEINQLQNVYLFKNEKDIKALWYVVSSYRTRINNDAVWRKDNIAISYRNMGNVRVLNTQQQISFMDEIHYDAQANDWKRDTVSGLAIMWGVTSVKGWGICGASRGINAAIITNKAFDIITRYNHTRTWKYLYQNIINGKEYRLPGLDVAVYRMGGGQKDFVFKNIRTYPVVLVMNYDGTTWWQEELFVLSHESDRGELEYIGKKGNCYSWEANSESFKSCYNSVVR